MKVLQVGKYHFPVMGGIEKHVRLLCQSLRGKVDLEVVVSHTRPRTAIDEVDGVRVTRCLELARLASVSINPTMPSVLSRTSYDVIHFHFPHPMGVAAWLLSRKPRGHRVVVTYHGDVVRQESLMRLYAPLMDRVLDRAAAIIATSPNYIDSSPVLSARRAQCRVVPLGLDTSQFDATPAIRDLVRRIKESHPGKIALGVGRLIYYKGFEHAIAAMREVDGRLLIIGSGPLRSALEARARDLGVSGRVHFLGNIPDEELAAYYYAADLFVLPSIARSEAFGIVQLEAMTCARPIVNTALDTGVPFVSRHGETGLTVPPGDAAGLAAAIRTLFADPDLARRMGEAGRRRVDSEFSGSVMADRTLAIYEAVR